jgi:hypothetical protein
MFFHFLFVLVLKAIYSKKKEKNFLRIYFRVLKRTFYNECGGEVQVIKRTFLARENE